MCVATLRTVHTFRRMCKENDEKFRKQLNNIDKLEITFEIHEERSTKTEFHEERIFSEPLSKSIDDFDNTNFDHENIIIYDESEESDIDCLSESINSNIQKLTIDKTNIDPNEDEIIVARAETINGRLKCEICDKLLSDRLVLKYHIRQHLGIKLHQCQTCKKSFAKKSNLTIHELSHSNNKNKTKSIKSSNNSNQINATIKMVDGKFECQYCGRLILTKCAFIQHIRVHTEDIVAMCKLCNRGFNKTEHLIRHMCSHLKTMNYPCEFCVVDFENEENLQKHIEFKHGYIQTAGNFAFFELWGKPNGKKECKCKICDEQFSQISKLRKHLLDHSNNDDSFATIDLVSKISSLSIENIPVLSNDKIRTFIQQKIKANICQHFYEITNEKGCELSVSDSETEFENEENCIKTFHKCDYCNQFYDRQYKLIAHMYSNHPNNEIVDMNRSKCLICNKIFPNTEMHKKHLMNQCENSEKKFSCQLCDEKFRWEESYDKHITNCHINVEKSQSTPQINGDDKSQNEYQCEICLNSFSTLFSKNRHMNRNHSSPKHACGTCNRVFNRKDHLQRHFLRHTKNKIGEYKCDKCKKKYLRKEHLQRHKIVHENSAPEKVYECYVCRKVIKRFDNLRTHMKIFHRREGDPPDESGKASRLCPHCGKSFNNSSNLSVHIRRHLNERPYKCKFCEKGNFNCVNGKSNKIMCVHAFFRSFFKYIGTKMS